MGKFGNTNAPTAKTAPPAPETCQKCGERKSSITMMRVMNNYSGNKEVDSVGRRSFMNPVSRKRVEKREYGTLHGDQIHMNDQYEYLGWVTRCDQCYLDDLHTFSKSTIHHAKAVTHDKKFKG